MGRRKDEAYSQVPFLTGICGENLRKYSLSPEMFSHDFKCGWSAEGFDFTQSPKLFMYNCISVGSWALYLRVCQLSSTEERNFKY